MLRATLLCLALALAACVSPALPPEGTPYAARITPGDNLYPRQETRIYRNDLLVELTEAHPANGMNASQQARALPPGTWARLLERNAAAPADAAPPRPGCCHQAPAHYTFHAHPGPLRAAAFEAALAERP